MPRLALACPLLLVAAMLVACGESHDDRDAGAGGSGGSGASGSGTSGSGASGSGASGSGASGSGASGSGASGSGTSGSAADAGRPQDPDSCMIDSDCGFGEIENEILKKSECPCLLGCPFIPQNRETITRRRAAYDALCEPGRDGQGKPCAIDDCVQMPDGVCVDGTCGGARR